MFLISFDYPMRATYCFLMLCFFSCNSQKKFDKTKWAIREDMEYPYRRAMLKDLTDNYKLNGLSYKQLIALLGEPLNSSRDSNQFYYPIYEYYGSDIDPIYTITLDITLLKDSTVGDFKVTEWKK